MAAQYTATVLRDVHLFGVVARLDEDDIGSRVIGKAPHGGLDGAKVSGGADEERVGWTALEGVIRWVLACCAVER